MSLLSLLLALAVPWVMGVAWLRGDASVRRAGTVPMVLGSGLMLGLLITIVSIRLWGAAGWTLGFWPLLGVLIVLTLIGFFVGARWRWSTAPEPGNGLLSWLSVVMAALILIRFGSEVAEVLWRPLYPWDAWVNWAPKAKLWFGLGHTVPILSPNVWLASASPDAYTLPMHNYPAGVPTLQLWSSLALGRWDPMLVNLPWLVAPVALGLALFGQLRRWGASAWLAFAACYLMWSLPIAGIHVALAGYVDLWLGAVYGMAAMAFFHWARTRDAGDGLVAVVFALACAMIKVQGTVWAMTFIPALIAVRWSWKVLLVVAVAGLAVLVTMAFIGIDVTVPGVGRFVLNTEFLIVPHFLQGQIAFHPTQDAFVANMFVMPNWHLFWYLSFFVLGSCLFTRTTSELTARLTLTLIGFAFVFVIFFMTVFAITALDQTTINRVLLHMVPMLMFVVFSILADRRLA